MGLFGLFGKKKEAATTTSTPEVKVEAKVETPAATTNTVAPATEGVGMLTKTIGYDSMKNAKDRATYENEPGVYYLELDGKVVFIGIAIQGVRKAMEVLYSLENWDGTSKVSEENRDQLMVKWQYCPPYKTKELEAKLFAKYGKPEWNSVATSTTANSIELEI